MATFSPVVVNVSEDGTVSSCTDACLPVFGYASAVVVVCLIFFFELTKNHFGS